MNKKKIFVFTTTRADYGLLRYIINVLQNSSEFETYLVVGGTHLSEAHGYTIEEIFRDNVKNIIQIPFLSTFTDATALTSSIGNGLIQTSQVFSIYKPDFLVFLGDRYELLIPAISCLMYRVPIIHLHGGEQSEGVIDEQVRHSITKIAHIHMASTEFYAENISKMGEEDWRIHIVGAPGLENIKRIKLYSKEEIHKLTNVNLDNPAVICTYHPVTLEGEEGAIWQIGNFLKALSKFDIQVVFTRPNAEVGSDKIVRKIKDFVKKNSNAYFFNNLGSKLYLSILKYAKAIVGNSSSGIIEAPSFHVPTVNIGNRQEGRFKPKSVTQTGYSTDEVVKGLKKSLSDKNFLRQIKHIKNPYGNGKTSKYTLRALKEIIKISKERILKKKLRFEIRRDEWHRYF